MPIFQYFISLFVIYRLSLRTLFLTSIIFKLFIEIEIKWQLSNLCSVPNVRLNFKED